MDKNRGLCGGVWTEHWHCLSEGKRLRAGSEMELSKTQLAIGKEKRLITMQTNGRGIKENGLSQDKLEHLYLHLKGECVEYLERKFEDRGRMF